MWEWSSRIQADPTKQPRQVQFQQIYCSFCAISLLLVPELTFFCFSRLFIVGSFREDDERERLRTVECLRGRLQAERVASKEAKEVTQVIARKVN